VCGVGATDDAITRMEEVVTDPDTHPAVLLLEGEHATGVTHLLFHHVRAWSEKCRCVCECVCECVCV